MISNLIDKTNKEINHNFSQSSFYTKISPIYISNEVLLATDCFVAPGVTIDSNTVIGARRNILCDIPQQQVAWDSPCRVRYCRQMSS